MGIEGSDAMIDLHFLGTTIRDSFFSTHVGVGGRLMMLYRLRHVSVSVELFDISFPVLSNSSLAQRER